MRILIVVSFLLLGVVASANAQSQTVNAPDFLNSHTNSTVFNPSDSTIFDTIHSDWDHLTIISDSRINKLLEIKKEERLRKKEESLDKGDMDGYRVQIYRGNRAQADKIYAKFLAVYPEKPVYLKFPDTDFVVRAGDCRSKSEAIKLKHLIEKNFPNPLIVEDRINFPKLESKQ